MRKTKLGFCLWAYTMLLTGLSHAEPPKDEVMGPKVVAFGTSLTARATWPAALKQDLSACLGKSVSVEKIAKSGASTRWAVGVLNSIRDKDPDIILLELYGNDAAINRFMTLGESKANIALILDFFKRELPRSRVIVMAMNP